MDVRCNRCDTEYDFDDALISERGTTVKCTNCGYQFKVFPSGASTSAAPERWEVRTQNGRDLVYTSLRELQRGIADRQVGPEDLLSRGREAPRALRAIAELEPFFTHAKPVVRRDLTLQGVAPPGATQQMDLSRPPSEPSPRSPGQAPASLAGGALERHDTPNMLATTMRGGAAVEAIQELPQETLRLPNEPSDASVQEERSRPTRRELGSRAADPAEAPEGPGEKLVPLPVIVPVVPGANAELGSRPESQAQWEVQAARTELQARPELRSSPESRSRPELHSRPELRSSPESRSRPELQSSPSLSSPFAAAAPVSTGRRDLRSYDELIAEELPDPARRARSRWIAGVVIAGVATLFAVTVGRRYLVPAAPLTAQPSASSNARVAEFLREGNRLLDDGDFEGAAEQLLRASALGEKDRLVLAGLARLETLRADIAWLRLRLLDPQVPELVQTAHRELGRRVGKARSAIDAAFAVAPEDIVVLRARVDTLRLSGEADKAREWIKPIAGNASDPENAYVLAALDLADTSPSFPAIIDRLRTAANGERSPGRAHAALVYALVRGERLAEAQAELAKLDARPAGAPLLDELKAFFKRHETRGESGRKAAAVATVDPRSLGKLDTSATDEQRAEAGGARGDYRRLLREAATSLAGSDLSRAEQLYNQVLAGQPGNTEALAGLADIARQRKDEPAAARLYDRVLSQNPSYLPALIARADQQWESGDRKAAVTLYRQIAAQASPGTEYAVRAAARIAESDRESTAAPKESAAPQAPPASPPASSSEIDTTDLPGFK